MGVGCSFDGGVLHAAGVFSEEDFEEIKELLEEAGFKSISQGSEDPQKAWFLLPGYGETRTREGFVDNYYFPY